MRALHFVVLSVHAKYACACLHVSCKCHLCMCLCHVYVLHLCMHVSLTSLSLCSIFTVLLCGCAPSLYACVSLNL